MKKNSLTLNLFLLIILNDLVDTIAQLIMKKGLIYAGLHSVVFSNVISDILKGASSPLLWIGILLYFLNFFIWIVILYKIDLSIAMPVGSTCYIFVPIMAILFLHEHVSLLRWLGTLCIIFGIHFVAQSKGTEPEGATSG